MSDIECPHFGRLLDFPGECTICSGYERRQAQAAADHLRTAVSSPFEAQHPGTCLVCAGYISIGEQIVRNAAESYIHASCSYYRGP